MVSMITPTLGWSAKMRRVASMPFMSGIWMSMRITSGVTAAAWVMASWPVAASPTTAVSAAAFSSAANPSRNSLCHQQREYESVVCSYGPLVQGGDVIMVNHLALVAETLFFVVTAQTAVPRQTVQPQKLLSLSLRFHYCPEQN
jgi:hypothetical protein